MAASGQHCCGGGDVDGSDDHYLPLLWPKSDEQNEQVWTHVLVGILPQHTDLKELFLEWAKLPAQLRRKVETKISRLVIAKDTLSHERRDFRMTLFLIAAFRKWAVVQDHLGAPGCEDDLSYITAQCDLDTNVMISILTQAMNLVVGERERSRRRRHRRLPHSSHSSKSSTNLELSGQPEELDETMDEEELRRVAMASRGHRSRSKHHIVHDLDGGSGGSGGESGHGAAAVVLPVKKRCKVTGVTRSGSRSASASASASDGSGSGTGTTTSNSSTDSSSSSGTSGTSGSGSSAGGDSGDGGELHIYDLGQVHTEHPEELDENGNEVVELEMLKLRN